jgi:hypothetical protein
MGAREKSLNNAIFVFKYCFGLLFCWFGLFAFNKQHPFGTGIFGLWFITVGIFFLSVARVKLESKVLKYRRWFCWHEIPYSDIRGCDES